MIIKRDGIGIGIGGSGGEIDFVLADQRAISYDGRAVGFILIQAGRVGRKALGAGSKFGSAGSDMVVRIISE